MQSRNVKRRSGARKRGYANVLFNLMSKDERDGGRVDIERDDQALVINEALNSDMVILRRTVHDLLDLIDPGEPQSVRQKKRRAIQVWGLEQMKMRVWTRYSFVSPNLKTIINGYIDGELRGIRTIFKPFDTSLGVFDNMMARDMQFFEIHLFMYSSHRICLKWYYGGLDATRDGDGNPFKASFMGCGPSQTGKSFVARVLAKLLKQGRFITYQTGAADTAQGNNNYHYSLYEEMQMSQVVATANKHNPAEAKFKEKVTSGRVTVDEYYRDEQGNRRMRTVVSMQSGCYAVFTNDDASKASEAVRSRFMVDTFEGDERLDQDMEILKASEQNKTDEQRKEIDAVIKQFHLRQVVVAAIHNACFIGILRHPTLAGFNLLGPKISEFLKNHVRGQGIGTRLFEQLRFIMSSMVIVLAHEYMCNLPSSKFYNQDWNLDMILDYEIMLKDEERMTYFLLSLVQAQYMDPLEEKILGALRVINGRRAFAWPKIFIGGGKGGQSGAAKKNSPAAESASNKDITVSGVHDAFKNAGRDSSVADDIPGAPPKSGVQQQQQQQKGPNDTTTTVQRNDLGSAVSGALRNRGHGLAFDMSAHQDRNYLVLGNDLMQVARNIATQLNKPRYHIQILMILSKMKEQSVRAFPIELRPGADGRDDDDYVELQTEMQPFPKIKESSDRQVCIHRVLLDVATTSQTQKSVLLEAFESVFSYTTQKGDNLTGWTVEGFPHLFQRMETYPTTNVLSIPRSQIMNSMSVDIVSGVRNKAYGNGKIITSNAKGKPLSAREIEQETGGLFRVVSSASGGGGGGGAGGLGDNDNDIGPDEILVEKLVDFHDPELEAMFKSDNPIKNNNSVAGNQAAAEAERKQREIAEQEAKEELDLMAADARVMALRQFNMDNIDEFVDNDDHFTTADLKNFHEKRKPENHARYVFLRNSTVDRWICETRLSVCDMDATNEELISQMLPKVNMATARAMVEDKINESVAKLKARQKPFIGRDPVKVDYYDRKIAFVRDRLKHDYHYPDDYTDAHTALVQTWEDQIAKVKGERGIPDYMAHDFELRKRRARRMENDVARQREEAAKERWLAQSSGSPQVAAATTTTTTTTATTTTTNAAVHAADSGDGDGSPPPNSVLVLSHSSNDDANGAVDAKRTSSSSTIVTHASKNEDIVENGGAAMTLKEIEFRLNGPLLSLASDSRDVRLKKARDRNYLLEQLKSEYYVDLETNQTSGTIKILNARRRGAELEIRTDPMQKRTKSAIARVGDSVNRSLSATASTAGEDDGRRTPADGAGAGALTDSEMAEIGLDTGGAAAGAHTSSSSRMKRKYDSSSSQVDDNDIDTDAPVSFRGILGASAETNQGAGSGVAILPLASSSSQLPHHQKKKKKKTMEQVKQPQRKKVVTKKQQEAERRRKALMEDVGELGGDTLQLQTQVIYDRDEEVPPSPPKMDNGDYDYDIPESMAAELAQEE